MVIHLNDGCMLELLQCPIRGVSAAFAEDYCQSFNVHNHCQDNILYKSRYNGLGTRCITTSDVIDVINVLVAAH